MAKRFKIVSTIEKRSRFDIFGFFSEHTGLGPEEQKTMSKTIAQEFVDKNANILDTRNFTIDDYYMSVGKFVVKITVE